MSRDQGSYSSSKVTRIPLGKTERRPVGFNNEALQTSVDTGPRLTAEIAERLGSSISGVQYLAQEIGKVSKLGGTIESAVDWNYRGRYRPRSPHTGFPAIPMVNRSSIRRATIGSAEVVAARARRFNLVG